MKQLEELKITATWDGLLADAYEDAVQNWLNEKDSAGASQIYIDRVFPLSCERIRTERMNIRPLDLLFVSVGTQAFAPLLGIVGNPAGCIALLQTEESRSFARQVEATCRTHMDSTFLHVLVDSINVAHIASQMKAVYESRGLPNAATVGADITGGRKTMTAAIAGVGSLFHWRLFYVEAHYERSHQGYGHHERIVELDNVLDVFGTRRRETALALLEAGAYTCAAQELKQLVKESAASKLDRELILIAEAAAAVREVEIVRLHKHLQSLAELASTKEISQTAELIDSAVRSDRTASKDVEANSALRTALLVLSAKLRLKNEDSRGAWACLHEMSQLTGTDLVSELYSRKDDVSHALNRAEEAIAQSSAGSRISEALDRRSL